LCESEKLCINNYLKKTSEFGKPTPTTALEKPYGLGDQTPTKTKIYIQFQESVIIMFIIQLFIY